MLSPLFSIQTPQLQDISTPFKFCWAHCAHGWHCSTVCVYCRSSHTIAVWYNLGIAIPLGFILDNFTISSLLWPYTISGESKHHTFLCCSIHQAHFYLFTAHSLTHTGVFPCTAKTYTLNRRCIFLLFHCLVRILRKLIIQFKTSVCN